MDALTLIIGIGIAGFLMLYLAFKLEREHYLLRLILIFFFFYALILIPKAAMDEKNYCDFVVKNITTSAPVDHYEYAYLCASNSNTTTSTFYVMITWLLRLFGLYILVYMSYAMFKYWRGINK